ncbi:hypothetical protein KFU94_18850 [Chloroflexi bacterium TSY]|nr:hypothetical protein [Chloroflexi bacterium TSY]
MTVPKRFGVLRLLGTLMKVLAWLILIAAVIFAISVGILFQFVPDLAQINWWTHLLLVIIPILENAQVDTTNLATGGGIITGIIVLLYAAGESLQLQVALEENTRLTAALLLRMHQESQIEPDPGYGVGGFGDEPTLPIQ